MKRIKVLHFLSRLEPGGIEKWLVDLTSLGSTRFQHSILCISGNKGSWAAKFEPDQVLSFPNLKGGYWAFFWNLCKWLRQTDFDIVHVHLYRFSAVVAIAALLCGRRVVVHSHNDKRPEVRTLPFVRRLSAQANGLLCAWLFRQFCSARVAASKDAAEALFGSAASARVIHCGIRLSFLPPPMQLESETPYIRLTAVGSLTAQKNHDFLISVLKCLNTRNPHKYRLTIIGDGPLRSSLANKIEAEGLSSIVFLPGTRDDVLSFLRRETDIFVFPSLFEGLGLAYIEAQATGLSCIVSPAVPNEADVFPKLISRVPLSINAWVNAIEAWSAPKLELRIEAYRALLNSDFEITEATRKLEQLYNELIT